MQLLIENGRQLVKDLEDVEVPHTRIKSLPTTFSAEHGVKGWERVIAKARTLKQRYNIQSLIDMSSTSYYKDWEVKLDRQ
jgi:hypothetical protein